MLFRGRLRAATELAWPGRGSSRNMPWPRMMPVPGTVTHEPNPPPWEMVMDTTLPSASAVDRCSVPGAGSPGIRGTSLSTWSGKRLIRSTRPAA